MAKDKNTYNCILYEPGDKVQEKYGESEILEVESADIRYVGIFPCQFLKFKDKPFDSGQFSNLFIPAEETIEKYKAGLKYFQETTVKVNADKRPKKVTTIDTSERLARQLLKKGENILTEEDLKPRVIPKGMFVTKPKIESENNLKQN